MTINTIGLFVAITTIITIWFGHVMVRKLEARLSKIIPAILICILLGLVFIFGSLLLENNSISAISGIIGITFLWDALEIKRQQKRVKMGHAPANPKNPRHFKILSKSSTATPVDILVREPRGKPYSQVELTAMLREESKIEANS
jgi:hypothetical protein